MSWADFAKQIQNKTVAQTQNAKSSYAKAEYYTFIIGISSPSQSEPEFTDLVNYCPRGYKLDEDGNRIESKFRKTNKGTEYFEEELNRYGERSIDDTTVSRWTSPQHVRSGLRKEHVKALDSIKSWVIKTNGAMWWHDGNSDLCSKFGGPHLHIIRQSVSVGDGLFQRLNTGSPYQTLCDNIKAAGGYIRSQAVRDLASLVLYLNTPPRVFMGSMCPKIGGIRACYNKQGIQWESGRNDILDEWYDDTMSENTESRGNSSGGARVNAFDMSEEVLALVAGVQKRKSGAGFAAGCDAGETVENIDRGAPKRLKLDTEQGECGELDRIQIPKETAKTKHITTLEKIMQKHNCFDKEALNTLTHTLGTQDKITLFIQYLTRTGVIQTYVTAAKDNLKVAYQPLMMMDFAKRAKDAAWFNTPEYYTIDQSLMYFIGWIACQNWPLIKFVQDVVNVYDKRKSKINTFLITGPSNTGKSILFNDVLQKLHPFYATYTCSANEDRFAFSEFPGKRVAFAHEGTFGTQQMEMAKMICGGQEVDVDVKFKDRVKVYRIPFFITSNQLPWILAINDADKLAFRNRCIIYTSSRNDEVPELKKQLHPGMWYYLLMALEDDIPEENWTPKYLMTRDDSETDKEATDDEDDDYEIE